MILDRTDIRTGIKQDIMSEVVCCRAVTYINNNSPVSLTNKELDLNTCYGDSEIVIKVHAAALNPVDVVSHKLASSYLVNSDPKAYGRDYSGVIVKKGKAVDDKWKVGDKVNGYYNHVFGEQGSLSDYLILDPTKQVSIVHMESLQQEFLGKNDEFVVSAAWPLVFATAYGVLTGYGQKLGENSRILVIGASTAVSNALIQIAKNHLHIGTVVGVCSRKSFDYNEKLGYDYLAAYDEGPIIESVGRVLVGDLRNEKFDLIFDSVGNNSFFSMMDKFLKPKSQNSHYITIVGDAKSKYNNISLLSNISIIPRILNPFRSYNFHLFMLSPSERAIQFGNELLAEGKYKPAIDTVLPISEFQKGIDRLVSSRAKGKVVFTFEE